MKKRGRHRFEPLKGKRQILTQDFKSPNYGLEYNRYGVWFEDKDVRSALSWLKKQIRTLKQNDGFIGTDFEELAHFIDMAFQDVIKNAKDN